MDNVNWDTFIPTCINAVILICILFGVLVLFG